MCCVECCVEGCWPWYLLLLSPLEPLELRDLIDYKKRLSPMLPVKPDLGCQLLLGLRVINWIQFATWCAHTTLRKTSLCVCCQKMCISTPRILWRRTEFRQPWGSPLDFYSSVLPCIPMLVWSLAEGTLGNGVDAARPSCRWSGLPFGPTVASQRLLLSHVSYRENGALREG